MKDRKKPSSIAKKHKVTRSTPPGEGERRAQRGYVGQYNLAAAVIYAHLDRGDLEWVGVADRGAGIADDLVLGLPQCVIGHQFKISQFPNPFTLRTFLVGAEGLLLPAIVAWKKLKGDFPNKKVIVRLVTNDFASTNRSYKLVKKDLGHTAAFLVEFERYSSRSLEDWKLTTWGPWIDELQNHSKLNEEEFSQFIQSLKILHGTAANFTEIHRLSTNGMRLAREIADQLPRMVADSRNKDRWDRKELLAELGWRDSVLQRHNHSFPLDALVQPNDQTKVALCQTIQNTTSGYISLMGPPGAGKSTLLQTAFEALSKTVVARYLAFVPGTSQGLGRGEAEDFLDDINSALKGTGLAGISFQDRSLQERRSQFNELLKLAGERHELEGIKTLIIVDGLDHVPREEQPERSFLTELPLIGAIPEGVLFVLGTQKMDLKGIKPVVQQQAEEDGRRIVVSPLDRGSVLRMADQAGLDENISRDLIFDLSKGHPLVTKYLLSALTKANEEERGKLLAGSLAFDGDIESIYKSAWGEIEKESKVRKVFDFLARADDAMPLELLAQVIPEEAIESALKAGHHLLNNMTDGWTVFHNSFRLFIIKQPKMKFRKTDKSHENNIYNELAQLSRDAPRGTKQHWLELRYLARAQEHKRVLDLATSVYFRNQFYEGRSFESLSADLRLSFVSAKHFYQPSKVFELLLVQDEINRRWDAYDQAPNIAEALLDLGELQAAAEFVEHYPDKGYYVVDALIENGDHQQARALFEKIEPIQLLSTGPQDTLPDTSELLDWANRVIHFRTKEQTLEAINRISYEVKFPGVEPDEEKLQALQIDLRCEVALALVENRKLNPSEAARFFGVIGVDYVLLLLRVAWSSYQRKDFQNAHTQLSLAFEQSAFSEAPISWRRSGALIAAVHGDYTLCEKIFCVLPTPLLVSIETPIEVDEPDDVFEVIAHARLASTLGMETSRFVHQLAIQHHAVEIGALLGRSYQSLSTITESELARTSRSVLSFLDQKSLATDGGYGQLEAQRIRSVAPHLVGALIKAAFLCGENHFSSLIVILDKALEKPSLKYLLSTAATNVYRVTGDTQRASVYLEEFAMFTESTPAAQLNWLTELTTLFVEIGSKPRAQEIFSGIQRDSLGYTLGPTKDNQYAVWTSLLQLANSNQPGERPNRVSLLMRQVSGMMETEGHYAAVPVAQAVLEEAMLCDAKTGWWAGQNLIEKEVIEWAQLVDSLMLGLVRRNEDMAFVATITWCELSLPYYKELYYNEARLGVFVDTVIKAAPATDVINVVNYLLAAVEAESSAYDRVKLLDRVRLAAKSRGIVDDFIGNAYSRWIEEAPPSNRSGSSLTYDDAISLTDLKRQVEENVSENRSDYPELRAFARLAVTADLDSAKSYLEQSDAVGNDLKARLIVAELAIESGERDYAEVLIDGSTDIVKIDELSTWSSWGSDLLPSYFRLKFTLEGLTAQKEAYENFIIKLARGHESIQSVLYQFKGVFTALASSPDWAGMWNCVADYITATREYAIGLEFSGDSREDMDDNKLIASLFSRCLEMSVPEMRRHAMVGALNLQKCKPGESVFASLIHQLLQGKADRPADGIQLLLLESTDSLKSEMSSLIMALADHDDYAVAESAVALVQRWGLSVTPEKESLPAFYSLQLEQGRDLILQQSSAVGAGLIGLEPKLMSILAFPMTVNILCHGAGTTKSHIQNRCQMIADKREGMEKAGLDTENDLGRKLQSLGLKIPFVKPEFIVTKRALRYVAGELRRSDLIPKGAGPALLYELGYSTPPLPVMQPAPRPEYFHRPIQKSPEWNRVDNWLEHVSIDIVKLEMKDDIVIAEISEFYVYDSRCSYSTTRFRAHALQADDTELDLNEHDIFPKAIYMAGVIHVRGTDSEELVCRLPSEPYICSPNSPLIVNPTWLDRLSWRSHPINEGAYIDQSGTLVARSVWWRDGGPTAGFATESIWSEGSFISLTSSGKEQLEKQIGHLQIGVYARRDYEPSSENEEPKSHAAFSIERR